MKVKNPPRVIGDMDWRGLRFWLIDQMERCKTERQLTEVLSKLFASFGTLSQIKKTRKALGIKPLTKEEEERMKK